MHYCKETVQKGKKNIRFLGRIVIGDHYETIVWKLPPMVFEAEGREFAKFLRSLKQFIQTVKGQNNFW